MATLYITEYESLNQSHLAGTGAPIVKCPPLAKQTVAISGSSTASLAFSSTTRIIRVHADSICSVAIGNVQPVASTSDPRFAANQTEYFAVKPGDSLAVISNT